MGSTTSLLRQQIIQQRLSLSREVCQQAARTFAKNLLKNSVLQTQGCVAVYLAQKNEIDLQPVISALWRAGKSVYLPVLHPIKAGYLWFAPYSPETKLVSNQYGILEPKIKIREITAPWELDVVLTPLVAFDKNGNRIGMGGGYYDRSFQFQPEAQNPKLIGCAYHWQEVPSLETQPWDVQLNTVVTD